jgi:Protein of unknown function (DUF1810)
MEIRRGLPGDPDDTHSRYIEAAIDGMIVGCLYLPNGNPAPGPRFDYKLRWFDRLAKHAKNLLATGEPVVLAGDYNVMPTDLDVYAPERWVDDALFRPEVRDAYRRLVEQGWTDALRVCTQVSGFTRSGNISGTPSVATPVSASDRFDLERFVTAQAPVFETVFAELRAGRKRSHWMWFVFPQLVVSDDPRRLSFTASAPSTKRVRIWPIRYWGRGSLSAPESCLRAKSIPSCDFRLARRHEVPVLRDAVLADGRRSGQSIPSGSRPLVRRATRRTDAGAYRLIPFDYSTVERLTLTMARDR